MVEIRSVSLNKMKIYPLKEFPCYITHFIEKVEVEDVDYIYISFDRNTKQGSTRIWLGCSSKETETKINVSKIAYWYLKKRYA